MTTIATLAVKITANSESFINVMNAAEEKTEAWSQKISKKLKEAGGKMTDFGQRATMGLTLPILGAGAAAFKMAADMQDALGATEQIYGEAANTVKNWALDLETYYGIAQSDALQYANMMGSMLRNIGGLSEAEAARQASLLIELAGDLTAMYGGTTADAVRALTGALKGNNTMLDNYGMVATDAMIKAKALELGLSDGTGELSAQAKQAATLALIMEQSAAAQGQAAREADGASGSLRALATETKNLAINIGTMLLPAGLELLGWIREIFDRLKQLTPEQQKWVLIILGSIAAIGPLLIVTGSLVTALGTIIPVVAAVAGALSGVALPILLIIGLLALLYFAWTNNWFGIRDKTQAVIDFIKGIIASGMQFIQDLTSGKLGWLSQVWQNAMDNIQAIIESALAIWRHIKQAWRNIENGNWYMFGVEMRKIWDIAMRLLETLIRNAWENIKLVFQNVIKKIIDYFKNIDWAQVGKNIIEGIINGLFWATVKLDQAIRKISQNAKDAIQGFFGIHSESKVMKYQVGWEMGAGVASGWEESINKLLMPQMGPGMLPEPVGAVAGLGSVRGGGQPVSIVLDYHPLISTADENEARFVLAPLIQDEIRKRAKQA